MAWWSDERSYGGEMEGKVNAEGRKE